MEQKEKQTQKDKPDPLASKVKKRRGVEEMTQRVEERDRIVKIWGLQVEKGVRSWRKGVCRWKKRDGT